nr:hypothetical protein RSP673_18795 [Ralstonia solanacearum P673]
MVSTSPIFSIAEVVDIDGKCCLSKTYPLAESSAAISDVFIH